MYQVILNYDEEKKRNYFYSYVESNDVSQGNMTCTELPPYQDIKKARACYTNMTGGWTYDDKKYNKLVEAEEEASKAAARVISTSQKLELFMETIPVDVPIQDGVEFPERLGYKWEPYYTGTKFAWRQVEDPTAAGTEANPIHFLSGMGVKVDYYYTDDTKLYVCIKAGNPKMITTEYFTEVKED